MTRRSRRDVPGSWHHVVNRGIARRTIFEGRDDTRYFLSRLAQEVRRGRIEVHAYSLLTTHYHLLVRSPVGELSAAMGRIQNAYVRYFNRKRRRDGPLFRGRFSSKRVSCEVYRRVVARYIDYNQVKAGLCSLPWGYPWGSAVAYVHRSGPRWLTRDWLEGVVMEEANRDEAPAEAYKRRMGRPLGDDVWRWVEARSRVHPRSPSPYDDMLLSAPDQVLDWMRRKARLADGSTSGEPLADEETVDGLASVHAPHLPLESHSGRPTDVAFVLRVSMLRDVACCSWEAIAVRTERTASACWSAYRKHHQRWLTEYSDYSTAAEVVAQQSIARMLRHM